MRKLYNEFFYIPKHGKIREKVMLMRVAMMVATVIFCLTAIGIAAYAYFSCNVSSDVNVIKAANFETNVSISITNSNGQAVQVRTSNYQSHKAALKAWENYTVTVSPTANSTAQTGFMILTVDGCNGEYHTQQLGVDANAVGGRTGSLTFTLTVTADADVVLLAHWGTSSYYGYSAQNNERYIAHGDDITITVNGVTVQNSATTTTAAPTTATTMSSVTTPATTTTTTAAAMTTMSSVTTPATTTTTTSAATTTMSSVTTPATTTTTTSAAATTVSSMTTPATTTTTTFAAATTVSGETNIPPTATTSVAESCE